MKTTLKCIGVVAFCCSILQLKAQEPPKNCTENVRQALAYVQKPPYSTEAQQKAITLLAPCVKANDSYALLTMGRLLLTNPAKEQEAFTLIEQSAEQGNTLAMVEVATLYKYGRGCQLNFNKARKWYTKAYEAGNDKAAYALGYLYLKGLGTIPQNYSKAVAWFEKSNYPMAQYWLGLCYYYGYGVPKNKAKASALLGSDDTEIPTPLATLSATTKKQTVTPALLKDIESSTDRKSVV